MNNIIINSLYESYRRSAASCSALGSPLSKSSETDKFINKPADLLNNRRSKFCQSAQKFISPQAKKSHDVIRARSAHSHNHELETLKV